MSDMQVFGLEKLEDRTLMAVGVAFDGTTLTITGDADDNTVLLVGTGGSGNVDVFVDEDSDGIIDFYGSYTGVLNINVIGGKGDDTAIVTNLNINGYLSVYAGAGDDRLFMTCEYGYNEIGDFDYYDGLFVDMGKGEDTVVIAGTTVFGGAGVVISTGGASDCVYIGNYAEYYAAYIDLSGAEGVDLSGYYYACGSVYVEGSLSIYTGAGDDCVYITPEDTDGTPELYGEEAVKIGDDLNVDTDGGHDYVEMGAGDETGYGYVHVGDDLDVYLGKGNDEFDIDPTDDGEGGYGDAVFVDDDVFVEGGKGFDVFDDSQYITVGDGTFVHRIESLGGLPAV